MQTLISYLKSATAILTLVVLVVYGYLAYLWQTQILPAQKGFYSPFENNISFIRYLGMIVVINIAIAVSAYRRDQLWVYIPLIATLLMLLLGGFYVYSIIKFE